jgi:ppGpp synthetase/RelA/SpoT-type nucleotidyltranferase
MMQQPQLTVLKMSRLYDIYTDKYGPYVSRFLEHLKNESDAIAQAFPELSFCTTARIKSKQSFMKKVYQKLEEGRPLEISDIFANKYIIQSIKFPDGRYTLNENYRINYCYKLALFLNEYNSKASRSLVSRKDYIKTPKDLYQSLHLQYADSTIPEDKNVQSLDLPSNLKELRFETQIKTSQMRYEEKDGKTSHEKIYKPRTILDLNLIPTYIEPVYEPNKSTPSNFKVADFESSFEKYYGFTFENLFGIDFNEFSVLPAEIKNKLLENHTDLTRFTSKRAIDSLFKTTSYESTKYLLTDEYNKIPNDSSEIQDLLLKDNSNITNVQKFEELPEK